MTKTKICHSRESDLQKACMNLFKSRYGKDAIVLNIHGSGWTNKGLPDLFLLHDSKLVLVELKNGDNYQVQPIQRMWQKRFTKAGFSSHVVTSLRQFEELIDREFSQRNKNHS